MAKIVVDTPTEKGLGFQDYADALVDIIIDSGSPFTIGILGKWGVGKTSLMQMMFEKLKHKHEENVIPVWFNAWRCERDKDFAFIPLLKLLLSEIKDKPLRKAFIVFIKSLQIKFFLPGIAEISTGSRLQNKVKEDRYYAELKAIETTLEDTNKKIVVFIDDLDRCAPDKILEVLESIKVFLDTGFVYVLGLDSEVVEKAIYQKYKAMGINGEDYLEKIVQIPFRIPDWNVSDRGECLTDLIEKEIDSAYKETFDKYKDIITDVIERTPRQVKRFINTYICEQEVFKKKDLDKTIHLILTILKFKWYDFYQNLFEQSYRQNLNVALSDKNKLKAVLKDKEDLIVFINSIKAKETIVKIIAMSDMELSEYRRAGMIMPQKITKPAIGREDLIDMLARGDVSDFNILRNRAGIRVIDLTEADLSGANLHRADLHGANLRGANLHGANLHGANLRGANLHGASLVEADLSGADLGDSDLCGCRLHASRLDNAILIRAILMGTFLEGCSLDGADLSETIILVKPKEYLLGIKDANFNNALINDSGFLEYLKENGAKNVPDEIANKDEIINQLKARGISSVDIEQFFEDYELLKVTTQVSQKGGWT